MYISTLWRDDADGNTVASLQVSRTPWHWAVVETVVLDWACRLTGHRWCSSRSYMALYDAVDAHTATFTVDVPTADAARFHAWRGGDRPVWLELDEKEESADLDSIEHRAGDTVSLDDVVRELGLDEQ